MIDKSIAIIIGGGESIKTGIAQGLWEKIKNKFVIGCNSNFEDFSSTLNTFVDRNFYESNKEELHNLPLVICKNHGIIDEDEDLIKLLATHHYHGKKALENSIYCSTLVGLFSMTLALSLGVTELFILGMDWTRKHNRLDSNGKPITHYFQEEKRNHAGRGRTHFYDTHEPIQYYKHYLNEKELKVWNVIGEPESNIQCFDKISYEEFFKKIEATPDINQQELRQWIKKTILTRRPQLKKPSSI